MIQIKPILTALNRHRAGTFLIGVQIALTLAIICNALFIIHERLEHLSRPTGIDEANIGVLDNQWVGKPTGDMSRMATDLATLRQLPGVLDAYATNGYPLIGSGWTSGIRSRPDDSGHVGQSAVYFVDEHAVPTLGVKLIAGRNFRSDEIGVLEENGNPDAPVIIVTKTMADKAFPDGQALGKALYIGNLGARPSIIIGIVERLQSQSPSSDADEWSQYSVMVPMRLSGSDCQFVVRARPGQLDAVIRTAPAALKAVSRLRVLNGNAGMRPFAEVRDEAYRTDRGMAILMGTICLVLLIITAAGIVGLSSFWVGQRRKQIGVRRALGATRGDILGYFLTENLLISLGGVVVGGVLAVILNLWMKVEFETGRLSSTYIFTGMALLLLLGQLAVMAPAIRASRVSPVEATRTV